MTEATHIEKMAREHCDFLFESNAARAMPQQAEGLIILAFTLGAAWALDAPELIALAKAQHEAGQAGKPQ